MASYWPWWAGALYLGSIATLHLWLTGKTLGVSGAWTKVFFWREQRALHEAEMAMAADQTAFTAELLRATEAEFGAGGGGGCDALAEPTPSSPQPLHDAGFAPTPRISPEASLAFLLLMAVGGALSAWSAGRWSGQWSLGPDFAHFVTAGVAGAPVLWLGGILVGFGTSMAGGCTSGHGLVGCARLQVSSILATIGFFGTGVVVSLVLARLAS